MTRVSTATAISQLIVRVRVSTEFNATARNGDGEHRVLKWRCCKHQVLQMVEGGGAGEHGALFYG